MPGYVCGDGQTVGSLQGFPVLDTYIYIYMHGIGLMKAFGSMATTAIKNTLGSLEVDGVEKVTMLRVYMDCQPGVVLPNSPAVLIDQLRGLKQGSIDGPTDSPMSCFDVGPGFAGGWGLCGYNCTAFNVAESKSQGKLVYCRDIGPSCDIACDTRNFPTTAL